jgi:hypothetical protein
LGDSFSDISGMLSGNRFSLGTDFSKNNNNYKILVMNARNVIEKKMLFNLMQGFTAIRYYKNDGQSCNITSNNDTQN